MDLEDDRAEPFLSNAVTKNTKLRKERRLQLTA